MARDNIERWVAGGLAVLALLVGVAAPARAQPAIPDDPWLPPALLARAASVESDRARGGGDGPRACARCAPRISWWSCSSATTTPVYARRPRERWGPPTIPSTSDRCDGPPSPTTGRACAKPRPAPPPRSCRSIAALDWPRRTPRSAQAAATSIFISRAAPLSISAAPQRCSAPGTARRPRQPDHARRHSPARPRRSAATSCCSRSQNLWFYGDLRGVSRRARRARRLGYRYPVAKEQLTDLLVAPFNPRVLKSPWVWAGVPALLGAGVSAHLAGVADRCSAPGSRSLADGKGVNFFGYHYGTDGRRRARRDLQRSASICRSPSARSRCFAA